MNELSYSMPFEERYQTPLWTCEIMADLIPNGVSQILEPTPGEGRLVNILRQRGYKVIAPEKFEELDPFLRVDAIVMNPPFKKSIEHQFLKIAMQMSDNIIALMPWFTLINCDSRTNELIKFGLKLVIHLPRSTFKKIRIQPCILQLQYGYKNKIELKFIDHEKILNQTNLEL